MIIKKSKKLALTIILTSALTISLTLVPISAHNPPYKDNYWYSGGDPDICFLDSELNTMKVNRQLNTANPNQPISNPASLIKQEVNDARQNLNNAIGALNMNDDGTTCVYPYIQVGVRDLPWSAMGATANDIRYTNQAYKASHLDFDNGYHYQVESNSCDWFHDKDIEWIANHELGHALSLDEHYSLQDHSMMKNTCSTKYSQPQTVDVNALGVRYT